jgi:predicted nucleic acid-binding protein
VKFWDASAIVPLLVLESSSRHLQSLAAQESAMLVWWGSKVECVSALARRERDGAFDARVMAIALQRLQQLADAWHEIDPSDPIRETAERFLRVHPLRAADALQLAAAFAAAERRPASLEIITLDDRLANAARKEGFGVVDLADG